ncbi:exported protein of unknown function [Ruminococcaceae bacterium BL-6]|nr:exported protein of unknown function [Ruminococcaceae bacterium BL-6]
MKIQKKFKGIVGASALILSLSVALTACGTNPGTKTGGAAPSGAAATASGTSQYKYGKIDIPGKDGSLCAAPIYIAYEKGFFAEEGFDVNLISADTETRKIGLNNGTIPVVNGDFQFFPSIEEGVKVKVVDGLHNGCIKIIVPKGSSIKTAKDLKENPERAAALLTAYNKAQEWIHDNPAEAVDIISEKKYSDINDKELATELLKNYEYPSKEEHASGKTHTKEDVLYFVKELKKVGYLKTNDPEKFANEIYYDVKQK